MLGLRSGLWWHQTRDSQDSCAALHSLQPCLGKAASQGKEAVWVDSGRVGEKSDRFEHPAGVLFCCATLAGYRSSSVSKFFQYPARTYLKID